MAGLYFIKTQTCECQPGIIECSKEDLTGKSNSFIKAYNNL